MKHCLFLFAVLIISGFSFSQEQFTDIDLIEYEGDYSQLVGVTVVSPPPPVINHDYRIRKSRRLKYRGLVLSIIGTSIFVADPTTSSGKVGGFVGLLGGVCFQICMIIQDIQTGVFIKDVEIRINNLENKFTSNNEYSGVIYFENNEKCEFKVIKFLEDNPSDPSIIIEYKRFGILKTETIKVNSEQLLWE
jgi:hypothetical protein